MNFITLNYWFSARPGNLSSSGLKTIVLFLLLLLVATVIAFIRQNNKADIYRKVWSKIFSFSLTNLLVGSLLLFLFYESVPFLSARILGGLWLVSMPIWLFFVLRNLREIPLAKEKRMREQEYKKYIP